MLDLEPAGVPFSDPVASVVAGVGMCADMDAPRPEVERLSVAFPSPETVGVCVRTTVTVLEDSVTEVVGPVDAAVQTDFGLCFLNELMDHVKQCDFTIYQFTKVVGSS